MAYKLRVLHIASGDLWAGAEVQALTLISHLARLADTEVSAVILNDGVLAAELRTLGISVHVVNEADLGTLKIFARLRNILLQVRPNVIHTHRRKENIIGSIANYTSTHVACVRTVHGSDEQMNADRKLGGRQMGIRFIDGWCGKLFQEKIIAVSQQLGLELIERFPDKKVAVIENGIDAMEIRARRRQADFKVAEPHANHIGIVGRLVRVKRVDLFIQMAAKLSAHLPGRPLRFHVFGEGPERRELEMLAATLGIESAMSFHGQRNDIPSCLGGLDALVMCSDHEGMPMVALEAMSIGTPIVAHAVGGLLDLVPKRYLVERHDAEGYVEATLRVLSLDPSDIAAASRHNERVLKKFSAQSNAMAVRKLYEQAVLERNGAAKQLLE